MTPELEQLADEAIELRCTNTDRAISSYRLPLITINDPVHARPAPDGVDHLDRARTVLAATWASTRPALAQLADARLAAIARLAEQGITPEPDCTVTVGRVTLHTVRDQHPVSHRYEVMRGRERVGWAWLSQSGAYTTAIEGVDRGAWCSHGRLTDALTCPAEHLNALPLTEAGTR